MIVMTKDSGEQGLCRTFSWLKRCGSAAIREATLTYRCSHTLPFISEYITANCTRSQLMTILHNLFHDFHSLGQLNIQPSKRKNVNNNNII